MPSEKTPAIKHTRSDNVCCQAKYLNTDLQCVDDIQGENHFRRSIKLKYGLVPQKYAASYPSLLRLADSTAF